MRYEHSIYLFQSFHFQITYYLKQRSKRRSLRQNRPSKKLFQTLFAVWLDSCGYILKVERNRTTFEKLQKMRCREFACLSTSIMLFSKLDTKVFQNKENSLLLKCKYDKVDCDDVTEVVKDEEENKTGLSNTHDR